MKICKKCGEINSSNTTYCASCGGTEFTYREEVKCPHCGAVNDKSFTHCVNCGNSLGNPQNAMPAEEVAAAPVNASGSGAVYTRGPSIETSQCPSCGEDVPLTSMFCQKCGTNVANLHEHRVVQRKICPHCGRPNAQDAVYCTFCYSVLTEARVENLQVVHDHRALEDGAVRQVFLESSAGKSIVCPNCGALNKQDEAFCVNCGLKLEIDEPKKYCPDCGAENPSDAVFCTKCNWSFEGGKPDSVEKWTCRFCGCDNDVEDAFCSTCGHKRKK